MWKYRECVMVVSTLLPPLGLFCQYLLEVINIGFFFCTRKSFHLSQTNLAFNIFLKPILFLLKLFFLIFNALTYSMSTAWLFEPIFTVNLHPRKSAKIKNKIREICLCISALVPAPQPGYIDQVQLCAPDRPALSARQVSARHRLLRTPEGSFLSFILIACFFYCPFRPFFCLSTL